VIGNYPHGNVSLQVFTIFLLRPMTPDGMPIIGMLPGLRNVAISTGHQMLGLTLAPASGDALAELLTTGSPQDVLEPFTAKRFTSR
jgi:D-amino-acid dehydrogenase